MEPSAKQTAIASGKQRSNIDDLPDHIVHKILNFLTIKDIARFSTLSQRCRKLCITIPNINIVLTDNQIWFPERARVVDFIDRFMICRNGLKLESFHLSWLFSTRSITASLHNEEYRIYSWLYQVARFNVERLNLWIYFQESSNVGTFVLPLCFTECTSFKYLKLGLSNGILKLPTVGFKFLQHVLLSEAHVEQQLFEVWLSNCKCLQKLKIYNIKGIESLNINNNACLQYLEIMDYYTGTLSSINVSASRLCFLSLYWLSYQSKRKLVFSAPNLETLVLEGDTDFDCHLRSLTSSLQKVSIYSQTNPAHFLSKNYQVSSSTTIRCYNQILQSVCHAKMLLLNSAFVKLPLLEVLPRTSIQSVHSLYLHVTPYLKLHDVNRIAFLLILFPNLKSLTLKSYFESAAPSANFQLLNSSMEGSSTAIEFLLSNCPKVYLVEIDLDREHNVLVLVKYLLMHAKELNKMKIYYSPEEHRLPSKIIRSIEAFRKASSTAAVYILPRVVPLAAKHVCFCSNSFLNF